MSTRVTEKRIRSIDISIKLNIRHIFLVEVIQQDFLCNFCSNKDDFKEAIFQNIKGRKFKGYNITKKGLELLVERVKEKKEKRKQALRNCIHVYGRGL